MPHISENEFKTLDRLLWNISGFQIPQGARDSVDAAIDILDNLQPAPQSDEVREAINWLSGYVESCKRDPQDRGERPEIKHIETLIRAAQSAPVDFERVREKVMQLYAYCPAFAERPLEIYQEALALLPTPSKE